MIFVWALLLPLLAPADAFAGAELRPLLILENRAGLEQLERSLQFELDQEEDEELIRRVQGEDDIRAMDELLRRHQGMLHRFTRRWWNHSLGVGAPLSYQDVEDAVGEGFRFSVLKFDPAKRYKLLTYAPHKIRAAVQRAMIHSLGLHDKDADYVRRTWLMPTFEKALARIGQRGEKATQESLLREMKRLVREGVKHPARRAGRIRYLEESRGRIEAWSDYSDWRNRASVRLRASDRDGRAKVETGVRMGEFLGRLGRLLTRNERKVLRLSLELPSDRTKTKSGQGDDSERVLKKLASATRLSPATVLIVRDRALGKLRRALAGEIRNGRLDRGALSNPELVDYLLASQETPEEQAAGLARRGGRSLSFDVLSGEGLSAEQDRPLIQAFLLSLRDSDEAQDRRLFAEYCASLSPADSKVIQTALEHPDEGGQLWGNRLGKTREAVRWGLKRAFGAAVLLANARLEGPRSFAGIVWRGASGSSLPVTWLIRLLMTSQVKDKEALLNITPRRFRLMEETYTHSAPKVRKFREFIWMERATQGQVSLDLATALPVVPGKLEATAAGLEDSA